MDIRCFMASSEICKFIIKLFLSENYKPISVTEIEHNMWCNFIEKDRLVSQKKYA